MDTVITNTTTVSLVILATVTFYLLTRKLQVQKYSNEPPYIPSLVPYFGHALGLLRHKTAYYKDVNTRFRFPIFTLAMPAGKVYVVNSPDLALVVQRHPKALSFWYLEALFGKRLAAVSSEAGNKIMTNVHGEEDGSSLFWDGITFLTKVLKPGPGLDGMNQAAVRGISQSLSELERKTSNIVDLWEWIRHVITMATTESTYGPMNPYNSEEVEKAFWNLSDSASSLLVGILPSIFARKGHLGREEITAAFQQYFEANGHKHGSTMTQGRYIRTLDHGLSTLDTARFESVQGITILSNTVPTAFWTIYHVFSRPSLLQSIRDEASSLLTVEEKQGATVRTLDLSKIREMPAFVSAMQEATRHQSFGAGTRMVMEDILLDNRYMLKKGSFLIMPNNVMHFDESAWGPSTNDFDAQRFVKSKQSFKIHSGAFRTFGGGANLCPGRFFAMTEILSLLAMLTLRYEIVPSSGEWVAPELDMANMSSIVTPPKSRIPVNISPRKGWEGGTWAFHF